MKEYLVQCAAQKEIELTIAQAEQFEVYYRLLLEWNEKINLTAITEPREVVAKHFIDSLEGLRFLPQNIKLVDVGTGAGFPAIPLKLVRPDIDVLLLDSLNKRILFLDEVIRELGLKGISALHGRAEELSKQKLREQFDVATARAVANLSVLSEYCLPYVKVGGLFLAYKGSRAEQEAKEAENAVKILGGTVRELHKYSLPDIDVQYAIVVTEKKRPTPQKYPRGNGKISKSPLA